MSHPADRRQKGRAERQPFRLDPRQQRWFDGLLAALLLLPLAVFPLAGLGPVETALAAAQIIPLFWRRSHALLVFVAVAAASALQALLIDTPLWGQVAFPVAVYSVARFSTALPAAAAILVGVVGAAVAAVDWVEGYGGRLTASTFSSYFLTVATIVVTAWALGTTGRTRSAYVDALLERGRRLELEAAQQAELAAGKERARIAREMHDVVAHGLSVMVVQADGARYAAAADPAAVGPALEAISTTGREALTEMRQLLGLLRTDEESAVLPQPGLAGLPGLLQDARAAGLEVAARLPDSLPGALPDDLPDSLPGALPAVPDSVGLTVYRLVQETLTNVRKHAGPGVRVEVDVTVGTEVSVEVRDDGRGAAAADDGRGLGLLGMRERVAVHGGTLTAGRRTGGGFAVSARIPL